ncbi:MAG: sulfite oxidase [Chloroflexi bacterium]|nr:sulfite oxidase [Chloroflexota bacterium]
MLTHEGLRQTPTAGCSDASTYDASKDSRLIVRATEPLNIETPLETLEGTITPLPLFFVRNNDTIPEIAPEDWELRIDGLVEQPYTLSYAELRALPSVSYVAVLQCCGNGRARFADGVREAEGLQWEDGAVGNAEWVGVPARLILDRAGVKASAVQVECIGGDEQRTTRGVEVAKLRDDAILAYAMNGQLLSRLHGGPVRLIVPGWGGINAIKWLVGMRVLDCESESVYNQQKYIMLNEDGELEGKVRELIVNSVISNLSPGMQLQPGPQVIRGFAWSPNGGVERVDISTDGGATWQPARLLCDLGPHSWRQFEWIWDAAPGSYTIAARATDASGQTQPERVPFNHHGYLMNAIVKVPLEIVV